MSRIFNVLEPCVVNHQFYEKNSLLVINARDENKQFVEELINHGFLKEWFADLREGSKAQRQTSPHLIVLDEHTSLIVQVIHK